MNELFRFLALRPAQPVLPGEQDTLENSGIARIAQRVPADQRGTEAVRLAEDFLKSDKPVRDPSRLKFARPARSVARALAAGPKPTREIRGLVEAESGMALAALLQDAAFSAERERIADTLVAVKVLSRSEGIDAPELALLESGYDAIVRATSESHGISLRVPTLPPSISLGRPPAPLVPPAPEPPPAPPPTDARERLERVDLALIHLNHLRARDFASAEPRPPRLREAEPARFDERLAAIERTVNAATLAGSAPLAAERLRAAGVDSGSLFTQVQASLLPPGQAREYQERPLQPWLLGAAAQEGLPAAVMTALSEARADPRFTSLPEMVTALTDLREITLQQAALSTPKLAGGVEIRKLGDKFRTDDDAGLVGKPAAPMPTGHGSVRPVGVGDLLLVREHVLRYEGGEVAHVENVLRSESMSRETRRLERAEQVVLTETETTKEEQRDTQTTERFSLKRETSDTIKTDTQFKAGIEVSAKYGPFIEVKANAEYATQTTTESAAKQAAEFSKDVVARSVSKIVERVREQRTTTNINEFEEKFKHAFDNTTGAGHVAGVYQWIDKVVQAQVYNYGKRLLFDVIVPEPATAYLSGKLDSKAEGEKLLKPDVFKTLAKDIDASNYQKLGALYDAVGLEPPPPPVKTISKAWDGSNLQPPHITTKSEILPIDDGYFAKYARIEGQWNVYAGAVWTIVVGNAFVNMFDGPWYVDMAGEVGSVPVAMTTVMNSAFAATVEIFCERTQRAIEQWQLKTHAVITQAYIAKRANYERALADAQAGVQILGRNPLINRRVIEMELRKHCITLVTGQHFDSFGALELSSQGYPQTSLPAAEAQGAYVRFFEQAFEWDHMSFFFYPYYWSWKPAWPKRALLDDVDPLFGDFLRAGAARAVFPVRPGFEAAVVHYLETGKIWEGGVPPDISGSTYLPIVKEIQQSQGAPEGEVPVGEPWLVRLPTTLVRLRPNDDLPKWKKVGEDWQADE